jgi:hypothetical protein
LVELVINLVGVGQIWGLDQVLYVGLAPVFWCFVGSGLLHCVKSYVAARVRLSPGLLVGVVSDEEQMGLSCVLSMWGFALGADSY